MGVGGDVGAGQLLVASLVGSYHLLPHRPDRPADPFVTGSLTAMGSSPYSATGVSLGGGVTYWGSRRLGLRVEGFRFWPVIHEDGVSPAEFSPNLWGVRGGLAFRFR